MSRAASRRYDVIGTVVTRSDLAVGGGEASGVEDLDVIRDGRGRLLIPGTSVAGVLRAAQGIDEGTAPSAWVSLWGSRAQDATGASASWICVGDAVATHRTKVERRDGVAIDRITGASAPGLLYSREVVPAGTRFSIHLTIEQPAALPGGTAAADDGEVLGLLHDVGGRLEQGVCVGSGTSTGSGRLELEDVRVTEHVLDSPEGVLQSLRDGGRVLTARSPSPVVGVGRLSVTIPWRCLGPVMVGVAGGGLADVMPLTTAVRDSAGRSRVHLLLPGDSLKGVLRARAERIVRTMRDLPAAPGGFLDVINDPRLGPVLQLFGAAGDRARGDQETRRRPVAAAVQVGGCRSTASLSSSQWASLLRALALDPTATTDRAAAEDPKLYRRKRRAEVEALLRGAADHGLRFILRDHVALDRWTGGAADGRLFSVLEPDLASEDGAWDPLRLTVDLERLSGAQESALCLLVLMLRDFCEGAVPVGMGTTRGMGDVCASPDQVVFQTSGALPHGMAPLHGATLADLLAGERGLAPVRAAWQGAWQAWLAEPAGQAAAASEHRVPVPGAEGASA